MSSLHMRDEHAFGVADLMLPVGLRRASSYGVAAVAVVVTLALKTLIPWIGELHPFLLLPVGIVIAAWYGGAGPAVAATLASAIGADMLFIPPLTLGVDTDVAGLLALIAEGLSISWITVGLRRARTAAKTEAVLADRERREAALAVGMRDELISLWTAKLHGPLSDFATLVDEARIANYAGDHAHTSVALDQLHSGAALMRRTVEHWQARGSEETEA